MNRAVGLLAVLVLLVSACASGRTEDPKRDAARAEDRIESGGGGGGGY